MTGQSSGKLVVLSESRRRHASAQARQTRRPGKARAGVVLDREVTWLVRSLVAAAGSVALSWTISDAGGIDGLVRMLAGVFAITASLLAARELRSAQAHPIFPPMAAGALVFFGIERVGSGVGLAMVGEVGLARRFEVLVVATCLVVGVWVISHSMRSRPSS